MMHYKIIDGKVIQKSPKRKKISMKQDEEGSISLEDYNYDVPKTPSTEDLIKDIIKRQEQTNEKINFLVSHFTQDLRHLPPRMFSDDNEDTREYFHLCVLALISK